MKSMSLEEKFLLMEKSIILLTRRYEVVELIFAA